jgi:hypothetical protein
MKLPLGIVLLWLAVACLWTAFHATDAKTPWDAIQKVVAGINGGGGDAAGDDTAGEDGEFTDTTESGDLLPGAAGGN